MAESYAINIFRYNRRAVIYLTFLVCFQNFYSVPRAVVTRDRVCVCVYVL